MTRKEHNIRLAYLGFYTMAEYAKLTGTIRQNIHQKVKKKTIDFITHFNKPYIKYDDGELANKIHGEQQNYLSSLLSFGFKMRTRNFYINDVAIADVKVLNKEEARISFYNSEGEMIIFIAKLKDTSIIKDNGII